MLPSQPDKNTKYGEGPFGQWLAEINQIESRSCRQHIQHVILQFFHAEVLCARISSQNYYLIVFFVIVVVVVGGGVATVSPSLSFSNEICG